MQTFNVRLIDPTDANPAFFTTKFTKAPRLNLSVCKRLFENEYFMFAAHLRTICMIKDEYNDFEEESVDAGRTLDEIGRDVVDVLYTVHKEMGPGLAEAVYEECLMLEFAKRNIPVKFQEPITIEYFGVTLKQYYVADILVEGRVIIELKAVSELLPVHKAQLLNYLKLTDTKLGYLVNFWVPLIKDGIHRFKNGY